MLRLALPFLFLLVLPADTLPGEGLPPPTPDAVTFWGHASVCLDLSGVQIVTDPVYDDSYSFIHKRIAPAPSPANYAGTDLVLISHAHRDHLSPKTLATFPKSAVILCPEPSADDALKSGLKVKIMRPWEAYGFPGGSVVAVPALHAGGKNSMEQGADGRALGYVVLSGGKTIYYTGDTEYFEGFAKVAERFRPDLVILNVNSHMNAQDAVLALQALGAPPAVAIHHGAYGWTNEARSPGWHAELEATLGRMFTVLRVGQVLPLETLSADRALAAIAIENALEAD